MSSSNRGTAEPAGAEDDSRRRRRQLEEEEEDPHSMCIPGLGGPSNRPKPRVLGTSFFGYVPDAYSMKTPMMPSERATVESLASTDNSNIKTNIQVRRFLE